MGHWLTICIAGLWLTTPIVKASCVLQPLKEKRKVGRPIAYCGDPESPNLTPAERRRIKRRIANRESARRVRARRQDTIEELVVRGYMVYVFVLCMIDPCLKLKKDVCAAFRALHCLLVRRHWCKLQDMPVPPTG